MGHREKELILEELRCMGVSCSGLLLELCSCRNQRVTVIPSVSDEMPLCNVSNLSREGSVGVCCSQPAWPLCFKWCFVVPVLRRLWEICVVGLRAAGA